jgi:hypothetical protein
MISTLKIPRVAGTLILALCGLAFHGAAQAIAIYGASSSLSVTVSDSSGDFLFRSGNQQLASTQVAQGDGSATANFSQIIGTTPLLPGLPKDGAMTSTAVVGGSADSNGSFASSKILYDLFLNLASLGPSSFSVTYTWIGAATATRTGDKGYATAGAKFWFADAVTGAIIDQMTSSASSVGGPSSDTDTFPTLTRTYLFPASSFTARNFVFHVEAYGTAVPAPAPLALIAVGLLAMGASRRRPSL